MKIAIIQDNELEYPTDAFFYKIGISQMLELNLATNEFKALIYIYNKTVGFKKKWDFLAKFLFEKELQQSKRPTDRALKVLEDLSYISVYRNASKRKSDSTARFNAYSISDELLNIIEEIYDVEVRKYNDL